MSAWATLRQAWRERDALGDAHRDRELAAFLPAALEIQRSPPHPAARWLARGLMALVVLFLLWAGFGQVNIVATAEGKIIPSSRVKQIQPLQKGVVKAILVEEGDHVTAGQALIELDATLTGADRKRLESDRQSLRWQLAVNESLLAHLQQPMIPDGAPALRVPVEFIAGTPLYNSLLEQRWLEIQAQGNALQRALERVSAEQAATRQQIAKLEKTLPITESRVANLKSLLDKQYVSENEYLEEEQNRIQQTHDLAAARETLKQLQASAAETGEQIELYRAQTRAGLLAQISEQTRQLGAIEEELAKARDIDNRQVLYAPVAGRVQDLAVSTVGGVVTEAQQLMLIVPEDDQLEVEAYLANKDIGFVEEGQAAEIKIHTFPFTKYGVIEGEVLNVSDDAVFDEVQGLVFRMRLRMNQNFIRVNGREVPLQAGMAVTGEVRTGSRSILDFITSPISRSASESMQER